MLQETYASTECGGTLIGLAVFQEPIIKFILPEFVSYLGERGVLCVGNG